MSPTHRSSRPLVAAVALIVALLAGCSADGGKDSADGTSPASSTTLRPSDTTDETTPTTEADRGASTEEAAYIDAVAEAMRSVEDSDFPIDDEQADCLAPRWVDAIGYRTLLDAGVTPEVLGGSEDGEVDAEFEDVVDRPRAEKLIDAFFECGIDLEGSFYDGLASDGSATPEQVDCLRDRLPDGFVRQLMVTSMDGGDDALDEDAELEKQLTDAFLACLAEG